MRIGYAHTPHVSALDRESGQLLATAVGDALEGTTDDQLVTDRDAGDDAIVAAIIVGAATGEVRLGLPDILLAGLGVEDHAHIPVVVLVATDIDRAAVKTDKQVLLGDDGAGLSVTVHPVCPVLLAGLRVERADTVLDAAVALDQALVRCVPGEVQRD